jgi:diaminopimelate epimerase
VQFSKGHGTENDFVLLPDPDGELDLTPAVVAALCDRRRGLGADGVLRIVRWAALDANDGAPEPVPGVEWFMDYRNADGSVAEMCGNGVRVYARYLDQVGWLPGAELLLGTRGGVREVRVAGEEISVDMGPAVVGRTSTASLEGVAFPGISVDVGNPHLACVTDVPLDGLDLTRPPGHDPALFPHGVNAEFVTPLDGRGEVRMRVHERGVGETRSCGTGTVAAVVAALRHAGRATGSVSAHTPGGGLRVTVDETTTTLHGPAVLVAHGELSQAWWDAVARESRPDTARVGV